MALSSANQGKEQPAPQADKNNSTFNRYSLTSQEAFVNIIIRYELPTLSFYYCQSFPQKDWI